MATTFTSGFADAAQCASRPMRPKPLISNCAGMVQRKAAKKKGECRGRDTTLSQHQTTQALRASISSSRKKNENTRTQNAAATKHVLQKTNMHTRTQKSQ